MHLPKENWHTRLFFWAIGIIEEFTDNGYAYKYYHNTNLCHYIRVIALWMPFVLLLHALTAGTAVYILFFLPFKWFGVKGFAWMWGVIAAFAFFVWMIWVIATAPKADVQRRESTAKDIKDEKRVTFSKLVFQYIVAVKRKFCPIVHFEERR